MVAKGSISRREFLYAGIGAMGLGLLAACAPQAPASPPVQPTAATQVPPPATKPAESTPAETKPAAAAPTQVPPKPATAPAAKAEPKLGAQLVGKLEGPEIVVDAARFPKQLKEAPDLAELVKAGKLPAVAERIGQDPLVIKPLHEIGKYGGTLRRAFAGPGDKYNGYRFCGIDNLLYWDYTCTKLSPNVARGYELQDGGRTLVIQLRRGMRWSDGQPFTADDFMFWFEDLYQNKELVPTPAAEMSINLKPVTVEKLDASTVVFRSPDPYPVLPIIMSGLNRLGGHAENGLWGMGLYGPAHYLKQFHPKYTPREQIDQKVKDAGFDNWVALFKFKNDWALNPELPVVTPWKMVTPINTPTWALERNPYSIWVDTEGNQLPYIDKIQMQLAENLEVLNLRAIAGELDFQVRHIDITKLPVFLENRERGGYKVHLDPASYGSDAPLRINMAFEADPEIAKWLTNRDFRIAMSLGIERDQLNEALWLGLGTPGSIVPAESSPYNPGPEYRTLNHMYDPKRANELLDSIGLDKKDSEGYRLRTDGKGRLRIELQTQSGNFFPVTKVGEMIREQWRAIGLQADVKEIERSLAERRIQAAEHQVEIRPVDGSEEPFAQSPGNLFPARGDSFNGAPFGVWYASGGAQGKEPPSKMKEAMELFRTAYSVSDEERIRITKEVWKIAVGELWNIGTVGLSPATSGVRIAKNNLGNVADRQINSSAYKGPGPGLPMQFYFK